MPPAHVFREYPVSNRAAQTTYAARQAIHRVLHGADDRLLVVVGPCSIHDFEAAMEYAKRLEGQMEHHADDLIIVMRVYFESRVPRSAGRADQRSASTVRSASTRVCAWRASCCSKSTTRPPCATEFLDTITPQYTADLIAWGAIGARTTESQVHRELAWAVVPGRVQERHRRQRAHRG